MGKIQHYKFIGFYLVLQLCLMTFDKNNFVECSCDRENPIYKDGQCQSIYCTETEFKNNVCSIDNEIIKSQWLNNFIIFNEYNYIFTNKVINEDGDFILITSTFDSGVRLFYVLKGNGAFYFKNDDNQEISTKTIEVKDGDSIISRYYSQVFLIKINNNSTNSNKQYLASISYLGYFELYDLEDENLLISKLPTQNFTESLIFSVRNSMIELPNNEYLYTFIGQKDDEFDEFLLYFQKYSFFDTDIKQENLNEKWTRETIERHNFSPIAMISSFSLDENRIVVFYFDIDRYIKIGIFNGDLNFINEKIVDPAEIRIEVFFKCIYFIDDIGIFAYYINNQYSYPKMLIEKIELDNFTDLFQFDLNNIIIGENQFNTEPFLNDLIKINDKRFSLISSSQDKLVLYIILFDLYNNQQNIKIRLYKIDIYNLYNYTIFSDISSIMYNNYLTLSMSVCNSLKCENELEDNYFTVLLFFNYFNGSDYNINITSYFENKENTDNDNDDIIIPFQNLFQIDNNIFGYQIQKIKIISIPNEIILYYLGRLTSKSEVKEGDEVLSSGIELIITPKNDTLKNDSTYFIEYQCLISELDYDKFNNFSYKIYDYPENFSVDQRDEFNENIQTYYGKTLKIEFKLCHENCKSCYSIGKSKNLTKCEECKDNYKYFLDGNTNTKTCFPYEENCPKEFPSINSDNNLECEMCTIDDVLNNKCYIDNPTLEILNELYNFLKEHILYKRDYSGEHKIVNINKNISFEFTNTLYEKEKMKNYEDLSIIDLGICEDKLKEKHSISEDESLIIYKYEQYYENIGIKNVQFEIYNPIALQKFDFSQDCYNETIDIYVPINLDNKTLTIYEDLQKKGYDIFNPNDTFYIDVLCTKYISENYSDLTSNDKINIFSEHNFCQENCQYKGINLDIMHAKCECSLSESHIVIERAKYPKLNSNIFYCKYFGIDTFEGSDLVDVTDYYNYSLIVTTSKKIYTGIPPKLKATTTANLINASSIIILNEKYLLAACLKDSLLTKINFNNGESTSLLNYDTFSPELNLDIPITSCSLSIIEKIVFIGYARIDYFEKETNKTNIVMRFNIINKESDNGPDIDDSVEKKFFVFPKSVIKTNSTKQISCEPLRITNFLFAYTLVCVFEDLYLESEGKMAYHIIATSINENFDGFEDKKDLHKINDNSGFKLIKLNETNLKVIMKNIDYNISIEFIFDNFFIFGRKGSSYESVLDLFDYSNGYMIYLTFPKNFSLFTVYKYNSTDYFNFSDYSISCLKKIKFYYIDNNILTAYQSKTQINYFYILNLANSDRNLIVNGANLIPKNIDEFITFMDNLFNNNETSKDNIFENFGNELVNGTLNALIDNVILKEKKSIKYEDDNILYELISTDMENNDNNISSINLGTCENKLKINNNISINDPLLMLKADIYEIGKLIPRIEYQIYNMETKQQLNLSICKDDKVKISVPAKIDGDKLYKYNISDDYYNDICSISDSNIDIILNDRRNNFYKNNMSVCEKDCTFKDYNFDTKKVSCECFIKIKVPLLSEIEVNKNKFINDISNITNIINLDIVKCYKTLFTKEGLIKNIGSYLLLSIIIINIIIILLFIIKGFEEIKNQINYIIKSKINKKSDETKNKKNKDKNQKIKKNGDKMKKKKKNKDKKQKDEPPKKTKKKAKTKTKKNINILENMSKFETMNDNSDLNFKKNIKSKNNKNIEFSILNDTNDIKLMKYNDKELNSLSYKNALIIDKRDYINYYFSLLKTKHIILFTFFNNDDYNSKLIKIYLLLFSFSLCLIVNALFFNDSAMHKIYEIDGNYSFINQIPIIFYSSIISLFIITLIKYLSLSENDIIQLKNEINDIINKSEKIIKCLKIKFTLFFILTFTLLIFFWYYISCFCAIYRNTQIHLIKDTLTSYALSLLYPFITNLLPGIFRMPSLRAKNKDKECLYQISKLIQLI